MIGNAEVFLRESEKLQPITDYIYLINEGIHTVTFMIPLYKILIGKQNLVLSRYYYLNIQNEVEELLLLLIANE